jgi:hypothetical protein
MDKMNKIGNMSKRAWSDIFFGLRSKAKPKRVKQPKFRKQPQLYTVERQVFGGIQTLEFVAYTKSEARAAYKREYGKIPPGTVFEKVA